MLALVIYARRHAVPALSMLDVAAVVAPIGLFLGRIANFIKPELWGRPTDVPWAMIFPDPNAGEIPRHPSQLYEAALEGICLFILLNIAVRLGGFRRPGLITGLFGLGYSLARIASEFFREPDPQLGFIGGDFATMGMILSLPMLIAGVFLIVRAVHNERAMDARQSMRAG